MRHRPPAVSEVLELKMLLSVVGGAPVVVVVVGGAPVVAGGVAGRFLTVKVSDCAPQFIRVNTMVRFSPAERRWVLQRSYRTFWICMRVTNAPLLRMARSVKLAQQVLNWMVVFPSSPVTGSPLESFRLAVKVREVTPTETQFP